LKVCGLTVAELAGRGGDGKSDVLLAVCPCSCLLDLTLVAVLGLALGKCEIIGVYLIGRVLLGRRWRLGVVGEQWLIGVILCHKM